MGRPQERQAEKLAAASRTMGFQAFSYPTSFASRLRWEHRRLEAKPTHLRFYQ